MIDIPSHGSIDDLTAEMVQAFVGIYLHSAGTSTGSVGVWWLDPGVHVTVYGIAAGYSSREVLFSLAQYKHYGVPSGR